MITIDIKNTGSAFDDPRLETARILRELADKLERGYSPETMNDSNGNRCALISIDTEQMGTY